MSEGFVLDIVNGLIEFSEHEHRPLNARTLRRLHHIRQLEFVSLVFPGCTHTRFEHTLGVTYLLKCVTENKQIVKKFLIPAVKQFIEDNRPKDPNFSSIYQKGKIDERFIETLLPLCGLIHDIGHGPFSHFSETIFELIGLPSPKIYDPGNFTRFSNDKALKLHEWIMCEILSFSTECNESDFYKTRLTESFRKGEEIPFADGTLNEWCNFLKDKYNDIAPFIKGATKILEILEIEDDIDLKMFCKLIAYGACGKIPGINSFIYGIFDLDRLDYLRRDSKMAGVKYGDTEVNRLLITGLTFDKNVKDKILIDYAKGIAALEHIYVGKEMLYSTTIYHPCSAAAKNMLLKFICELPEVKEIKKSGEIDWNKLIKFLIKIYSMEDPDFIEYLRGQLTTTELDEGSKSYLTKLLNRNLYKKLAVFHWSDLHPLIREEIINSSMKGFSFLWKKNEYYEEKIGNFIRTNAPDFKEEKEGVAVIVNLPYYKKEWADIHEAIARRKDFKGDFSYHQATEVSPLLDAVQKSTERNKIVSVYLNPVLFREFNKEENKKQKSTILEEINNIFGSVSKADN